MKDTKKWTPETTVWAHVRNDDTQRACGELFEELRRRRPNLAKIQALSQQIQANGRAVARAARLAR